MTIPPVTQDKVFLFSEGLRAFRLHFKGWLKIAAVFFIVLLPINYAALVNTGQYSLGNPAVLNDISILLMSALQPDSKVITPSSPNAQAAKASAADAAASRGQAQKDHAKATLDFLARRSGTSPSGDDVVGKKKADNADDEPISPAFERLMKDSALQNQPPPVIWLLGMFGGIANAIVFYFFYGFFLRKGGLAPDLKLSVGGFLFFVWKGILKFLMIFALVVGTIIAVTIAGVIVALVATIFHPSHMAAGLFAIIAMIGIEVGLWAAIIYWMIRYGLVGPLATARVQATLKASSVLTRGNMLRIFGNNLLFYIVLLLPFLLYSVAASIDYGFYAVDNIPLIIFFTVFSALLGVFFTGINAAYNVAICTVLVSEKQAVEPGFKLVSFS